MKQDNLILSRAYDFALHIIAICRSLDHQREFVLSRQLLRSGTSIGANVEEAQAAQSRADFVSKMSIAAKKARETRYWLRLLADSHLLPTPNDVTGTRPNALAESEEIIRILISIVKTTSDNL